MSEDEGRADDVADLAWAGGDVAEGAPAAGEQGEPAFAQAAQGTLDGVAGAGIDIQFPWPAVRGWLRARDRHNQAVQSCGQQR
jgi:hypothetical protein